MTTSQTLTRGPIERQLAGLALPLIAGNILQQLYNTIDALVIGRFVGQTAFAAIGVAGTVMNLFLFIISGGCAGVTVLFARSFGAGDLAAFRRQHALCALYGSGCVALLSAAGLLFLEPLLRLIQTPAEVALLARKYLNIILAGLLCSYFYNLFAALLRAAGNTRVGLAVLAAAISCNLVLDITFVAGLGWGIAGAARATVISQLLAALLCLGYIRRRAPGLMFGRADLRHDGPLLRELGQCSLISAMHGSSLYIGKILVQGAVNSLGTEMITAYTAASRVEAFANSFGDSGSSAISVFIGQNLGAGKKGRIRYSLSRGGAMLVALALLLGAAMAIFSPWAVRLLLGSGGSESAVAGGVAYLRVISLFYPLCYIGNLFVGWFRGLGMMAVPTIDTALHITVRVVLSWLLVSRLGLPAVAVATGMGWCLVFVFFNTMLRWLPKSREYYSAAPDTEG